MNERTNPTPPHTYFGSDRWTVEIRKNDTFAFKNELYGSHTVVLLTKIGPSMTKILIKYTHSLWSLFIMT